VFAGLPGNTGYSIAKPTGSSRHSSENSISHSSLPNELTEPGVPNHNDNKLHPFGLLWSELEGPIKHAKSSIPSGTGRAAPFGVMADPALAAEPWSDVYRKNTIPEPMYQDAMAAHHLSRMEQESNHFDLAEHLRAQQFQQQQLQQRNLLSHAHINESVLDHVPTQNLIHHQQLANRSAPDLDHLLTLQLQQQRQIQLQHHQLQQQQQFHQQQKLLQEQQQSQVRQVLLEQLLRNQMHDPGLGQSHMDPIRAKSVLDQVLLERHLLHEMQQQSHHPSRHVDPSLEQLIQAKFSHMPQQDHQRDLFELLSRSQHGQMSLEQQLLQQDQLQARQLMGLRQRTGIEGERHIGSKWPTDESDQFLRTIAGSHRAHSSGFGPLDVYQRQQRPPHEEQLNHLERNVSVQERLRQGIYDPGSLPFERTMSLPAGAPGMNPDVLARARARGLDMQEPSARMQSASQVGAFSPGIHPHNPHHLLVPNQFHTSELDAIEGRWSENNEQLENDWIESRIQQLHINAERQKRESEIKMTSQDPTLWMSDGFNDEKSKQLLMELLHQKSGHQSTEPLDAGKETRATAGLYSGSSSSDHPFSLLLDREAGLNNSFAVGSYGSNSCEPLQDEWASSEIMPYRSDSGALIEGESRLAGINETGQAIYTNSSMIGKSSMSNEFLEADGRKHGSKSVGMMKGPAFEIQEGRGEEAGLAALDRGEISINALNRQSSIGTASSSLLIVFFVGSHCIMFVLE
jgi:PERQ amino acid-rich with GYF domain-containing protein